MLPLARTIGSRVRTSPAICEAAARPRTETPIPRRSSPCASSSAFRSDRNRTGSSPTTAPTSSCLFVCFARGRGSGRQVSDGPPFGNDPVSPPSGGHEQDPDRPLLRDREWQRAVLIQYRVNCRDHVILWTSRSASAGFTDCKAWSSASAQPLAEIRRSEASWTRTAEWPRTGATACAALAPLRYGHAPASPSPRRSSAGPPA